MKTRSHYTQSPTVPYSPPQSPTLHCSRSPDDHVCWNCWSYHTAPASGHQTLELWTTLCVHVMPVPCSYVHNTNIAIQILTKDYLLHECLLKTRSHYTQSPTLHCSRSPDDHVCRNCWSYHSAPVSAHQLWQNIMFVVYMLCQSLAVMYTIVASYINSDQALSATHVVKWL